MNKAIEEETLEPELIRSQAQKKTEAAFVESGKHKFLGKPLFPLCIDRQIAAEYMGLKFGKVRKEDQVLLDLVTKDDKGKKKITEIVSYRQIFTDIIIIMWLCSVKMPFVEEAQSEPKEAMRSAKKWASGVGLSLHSAAYNEGWRLFYEMMGEVANSQATPVSRIKGEADKPPGE